MSDILLAKPNLDSSWLDTSVGEAHVVRDALLSVFDVSACDLPKDKNLFEYQQPQGYQPLVKLLEDKYQAPVVITNGAKQGLGSVFYSLRQLGKNNVYLPRPFWALLPPLMDMHGINYVHEKENFDSYLCVAPNNPCGSMPSSDTISYLKNDCGIPTIHDAVYHSHIYLPSLYKLEQFGDVQIYSASKSFGLSSIRIGWAVCPNVEFYKLISQYMEAMTVGASVISQLFLYNLLKTMHGYPTLTQKFEALAFDALQENKRLIKQIDPEILQVPDNMEDVAGMFGFFKIKDYSVLEKAKINAIDGKYFGVDGYVRINLALRKETLQEIVNRLNSVVR
jgi:aspartate/methionine/tyrosine aminotransferase